MQSDELYRFVALRSTQASARERPADPFIDAYGEPGKARTALLSDVSAALAADDLVSARDAARGFIAGLNLLSNDPWDLTGETSIREMCVTLAALVRRGTDADAANVLADHSGDEERSPLLRNQLADLLLCLALLPDLPISIDTTAQIILGLETLDRLNDRDAKGRATIRTRAWRIPFLDGRVCLPIRLAAPPVRAARAGRDDKGPSHGRDDQLQVSKPRSWTGDLILMRQQVRGYQLGEIAHVENVLIGESFKREFQTIRKTEQTLTTDTDVTHESERDTQTTTRDELRNEIQKALAENLSISANFNVQASYNGGSYSVVAGGGVSASYQRASEERESTSSDHAHEVVDKAVQHIVERVHTIQETLSSYEEDDTSTHSIDNAKGASSSPTAGCGVGGTTSTASSGTARPRAPRFQLR